ncbi:MAG: hypothetical protein VYE27_06015 [Pseudomonadota bacterium]|nr:hypothetical protein [Pseudomonadota bacterium]
MTALKKYSRLESSAYWKETQSSEERSVIISVGKTSLIISNYNDDPITHWSLNSIKLVDYKNGEAVFSPNIGDQEKLIVTDAEMIKSLQLFIETKNEKRTSNYVFLFVAVIALITLAISFFPFAKAKLQHLTLSVVSEIHETQIAQSLLQAHLPEIGPICQSDQSDKILKSMVDLAGIDGFTLKLTVLKNQKLDAIHLPGGILLISEKFLRDSTGPAEIFNLISRESKVFSNRVPLKKLISNQSLPDLLAFLLGLSDEFVSTNIETFKAEKVYGPSNSNNFLKDFTWMTLTNICLS